MSLLFFGLAAAMISPDTRSSGEMVIEARTRRHPVARGTSISNIAMASMPRRRVLATRDPWDDGGA
ncbi:Uncharacterised protein [Mycobacterium tuberculosis]|uniref:Uncharacterized protein n=1 Tax=Mycobacterium tuberculosis TaxID=1773 RepID=A0A655A9Y3_MYCTX|nr:Uncharacterised protein [Mycobacterium tuberculosis]CKR60236.1 Uncharacterised protein [Mycobacterium tuberculosis]CKS34224.1 Uncharacterised protein [Mycobacterium tuberculosis]CKT09398.1 Uncharacterised protein [Mycobacterium tuberculosis]COV42390.1 Uncharacterised protein [Mycobacterium tuberculosis]